MFIHNVFNKLADKLVRWRFLSKFSQNSNNRLAREMGGEVTSFDTQCYSTVKFVWTVIQDYIDGFDVP